MGSTNQIQIMFFQKVRHHIGPEDIADPSVAFSPALNVRVGVAPEQVAENAGVGHFKRSFYLIYLLEITPIDQFNSWPTICFFCVIKVNIQGDGIFLPPGFRKLLKPETYRKFVTYC